MTAELRERALAAARRHRPALSRLRADLVDLERRARELLVQARGEPDTDYLLSLRAELDHACGQLGQVAGALDHELAVLDRVAEVLGDAGACGLPWPVCPHCLGQALTSSGRQSWCPSCRRRWPDLEVDPWPWPAAATVTDRDGERLRLCASHSRDAARRLVGAHVARDRQAGPGGRAR